MHTSSEKGFTLTELLVVLALLGILAAIAIPLYSNYQLRSGRSEGTAALLDLAQQAERFFVRNNTYTEALPAESFSSSRRYQIAFEATDGGLRFNLTATPLGAQNKDRDCREIHINNLGQRTALDASGNSSSDICW